MIKISLNYFDSAFFYQNSDIKSTELEGSIVYNPSQKNEWNEKINTFLSYDGSYFSTIIIKDEDGKSHMFSSNGNIDKVAENKFEVISINKKISGNDIEIRGSEAYENLSKIDGYKIIYPINLIYKDNKKRILERPTRDIKFLLLKEK